MSSLTHDPKSGFFRVQFRYGGKQFQKSLKTTNQTEAEALKGRIDLMLLDLARGRKTLPEGADLWQFLLSDGARTQKTEAPKVLTLEQLFTAFLDGLPPGSMEANSLATSRLHQAHLLRILGKRTAVESITTAVMQKYVNERAKEKHRGNLISPATIKLEVNTFRAIWNWGRDHLSFAAASPTRKLRYEKEAQQFVFQTWRQIEERVARGGLTPREEKKLWDSLFLNAEEISACLEHVRATARYPFVYPLMVFIAHTGARRSEALRSQVEDLDFERRLVHIREKKRDRRVKESRRSVHMTPLLARVLREWLDKGHPGGSHTFCHGDVVQRSRKRSETTGHQRQETRAKTKPGREATVRVRTERPGREPLTKSEASHHFRRTLAGSKWKVLRGFHVFPPLPGFQPRRGRPTPGRD